MSVAKKLLIKPGNRVLLIRAPQGVTDGLGLPDGVEVETTSREDRAFDVVVAFISSVKGMVEHAPQAIAAVREGGVLWFAYPKKTSGVASDLSRDDAWQPLIARG